MTPTWFSTTCKSTKSLAEIYRDRKARLGTTLTEQKNEAKKKYREAFQPLRRIRDWEKWLTTWEGAMVRGLKKNIPETTDASSWAEDFIQATSTVFPQWGLSMRAIERSNIEENTLNYGRWAGAFRTDMITKMPTAPRIMSGAFEPIYAGEGASDDNQYQDEQELSRHRRKGGRPKRKHLENDDIDDTRSCEGCGQNHPLENCYYIFPEKAKSWFRPREEVVAEVDEALRTNEDLRERVQALKRKRLARLAGVRCDCPHWVSV